MRAFFIAAPHKKNAAGLSLAAFLLAAFLQRLAGIT